jgi:internalin A
MTTHFKILQKGTRRWLSVDGPWEARLASVMDAHGVSDLQISADGRGSKGHLDFLRDLPFLERLSIIIVGLRDISPLYDLPNLRTFEFQPVAGKIDFLRFPKLEVLRCSWNARTLSSLLEYADLKELGLDNYTGPDLRPFAKLSSLENIGMAFTRLESLAGVERLPNLRRLSLGPINRLETLDHLQGCSELRDLSIGPAKNLARVDTLSCHKYLAKLYLQACPNIESLQALKRLVNLEYFGLLETTTVADGDLATLLTLPKLKHATIRDRQHYNVRNSELPKAYRHANKVTVLYQE